MTKVRESCFCAFCKNERKVFSRKHISFKGVFASFVLAGLVSLIIWQKPDPRAIVFLVSSIVIMEVSVNFRWRLGMICPYCAFDPILYRKSPAQACAKVKVFMENRRKDPMFYLSSNGYEKLNRIKRSSEDNPKEQHREVDELGLESNEISNLGAASQSVELDENLRNELLNMPPV